MNEKKRVERHTNQLSREQNSRLERNCLKNVDKCKIKQEIWVKIL